MLLEVGAILLGLILLTFGSDRFVVGAAALANNLGISPLVIGLTIVGFATSAPEILVAGTAALNGNSTMAIGNALGSNIANIGLVLGATALVMPLTVQSGILKREYPLMFLAMLIALGLMWDHELERLDGAIMLVSMFTIIGLIVWMATRSETPDPLVEEFANELPEPMGMGKCWLLIIIGLAMMLGGSNALVYGAVEIAKAFGVSELVIGLTIVAVGTSLPELAASVMSAIKGEPDIALGNVIGSNMFNILVVMCVPGLINPASFGGEVITRDFSVMFLLSIVMLVTAYGFRGPGRISRAEGLLLLAFFVGYQFLLFYQGAEPAL